ncbi:MAG: FAD/NAD(P)-binding oxidoreductase [Candidatus Aramenus sulfurataquae]|jgi:sulfide:quinone oxidoreductase|nr:NAD(P)/FAD-dependent oxidoreductase [Candidatus Aramenus sulfurataquae]
MKKKVVVIGGGIGGMGVATTLAGRGFDVTVVNKDHYYVTGPSRPLLLTGEQRLERMTRGYEEMGKQGIKVITGNVYKVDPANRKVYVAETYMGSTREFTYDYLVVAPGVVYDGSKINGYDKFWWNVTNVYDLGRLSVLKEKLWSLNSGNVVVYAPKAPYRCAPAPTETAMLIHTILVNRG